MNTIVLRYQPHEVPPTDVPFELRTYYSQEVWEKRLPAITRKASRYYKKNFQFVWAILFFACSIAVPIGLYYVALDRLPLSEEEKKDDEDRHFHHFFYHGGFDRWWRARLISLASFLAVLILFYAPMLTWKHMGKKNVNKQLQKWEKEDRASRSGSGDVPIFKLRRIGIFSSTIKLQVILPMSYVPVSNFHPAAQLPAYLVNRPTDPNVPYYYGQSMPLSAPVYPGGAGIPLNQAGYPQALATSVSGVPLYNANDEKSGFVNAEPPPPSAQSHNGHFEDVKV